MRHRTYFTEKERRLRSILAKIVHNYGLIHGTLYPISRRCGKSGCRCNYGKKHISIYLSQNKQGKTKLTYIPKEIEQKVTKWSRNYKRARKLLEEVSEECLKRLIKEKEGVKKIS